MIPTSSNFRISPSHLHSHAMYLNRVARKTNCNFSVNDLSCPTDVNSKPVFAYLFYLNEGNATASAM